MNENIKFCPLGDVCNIQRGLTYSGKDTVDESNIIVLRATNIDLSSGRLVFDELKFLRADFDTNSKYLLSKGSLLICFSSGSKSHLGKVALVDKDYPNYYFGGFIGQIVPSSKIDSKFLYYLLISTNYKEYILQLTDGININNLKINDLKSFQIPLPPLPEQQRIVSILDHCFEAIDKAKAIAEQNLQNAKEVFESYLQGVFEKKGDGWEKRELQECFRLKSGDGLTTKMMNQEGEYHVYGGNGVAGLHDSFNLSGNNVIIGRVGALCGNARHITEEIWLTDNAFKVMDMQFEFDNSFLTYLLNYKNLRNYARQAAQPVISNSSLKSVVLNFPKAITEQQRIVQKLDALQEETKKLEVHYQKKLSFLEELKKSVLQKAFAGELKTEKATEYV